MIGSSWRYDSKRVVFIRQRIFPSSQSWGVRDLKKISAKPPLRERPGWSDRRHVWAELTTITASRYRARASRPSAPLRWLRDIFNGAASLEASPCRARAPRPPLRGGRRPVPWDVRLLRLLSCRGLSCGSGPSGRSSPLLLRRRCVLSAVEVPCAACRTAGPDGEWERAMSALLLLRTCGQLHRHRSAPRPPRRGGRGA